MTIDDVKTALLTVTNKVYHYTPPQNVAGSYIVWSEDGQGTALWADGQMQNQAIQGTIDHYSKTENDPQVVSIQTALNAKGIPHRLNSVQHERDTGYIHTEWVFEVDAWRG